MDPHPEIQHVENADCSRGRCFHHAECMAEILHHALIPTLYSIQFLSNCRSSASVAPCHRPLSRPAHNNMHSAYDAGKLATVQACLARSGRV